MKKFFLFCVLAVPACTAFAQIIGYVDKKTKEFTVPADQKIEYQVFGYQFANTTTRKMICFSSHSGDVRDNYSRCPLGSYFDTDKMKPEDKIIYLTMVGIFAKMNYIAAGGQKTIFYLPKSSFSIK